MSPANTPKPTPTKASVKMKPTAPNTEISQAEAHKNRQYITIMYVVTGAVVIIGGFIVYRLFTTYIRKTNEVKAQDKYISALQQKKLDLVQLDSNYKQITLKQGNGLSIADLTYRALPTTPDYKSLIGMIENIAQASGVKASVSPPVAANTGTTNTAPASDSTVTTGNTPQPFTISVSMNGPYEQLLQFLHNSEVSLRPLNFKSMTISGTSGVVEATVTFETYYQGLADISNKQEPLK